MISFLFAALLAWHLVNMYLHAKKGTVPKWLEQGFYEGRNNTKDKVSVRSTFKLFLGFFGVMLAPALIMYQVAKFLTPIMQPVSDFHVPLTPMQYYGANPLLYGLALISTIYFTIFIGKNIRSRVTHYENVGQEEKKDKVRAAYGAKGWASNDQINHFLGRTSQQDNTDNLTYALHVGSGFYWHNAQGHLLTVGGSRGGKGVNLILPALLSNALFLDDAASFVVLDPKGENLAVAGAHLKECGYNVLAINPFSIPEIAAFGNSRFNPFDLFNGSDPDFDKYADMIGYALVPPTTSGDAFWDNAARGYISLYIRHMMTQDEDPKTFRTLYKWLRLAGEDRTLLLAKMINNDAFDGDIKDEANAIFGQLVNDGGKTVESIYATVRTATDIFKDMQLRESVSGSDLDIRTIAHKKTAVFVCLNPSDLERCQVWLRLFFGSVMRGLTKYYNPARKVVLLMDEFPTLGTLKEFEQAAGFLAGYNVTLWPVMQDLTQLKNLYPNSWETFVNNAIIRHYLAIGDNFTADYISKRMPMDLRFVGNNADGSPREIQKPLLEPAEVMTFPNIIMEIKGMDRPAGLKKMPYWEMSENGRPNPFRG